MADRNSVVGLKEQIEDLLKMMKSPPPIGAWAMRDPIEFVEPKFQVYHPHHTDLIGRGATEEEAMADLQAQVDEIREKHMLRHPFQHCGCIVCEPWNHAKIQS
jgi:hypothetical protein